MFRESFERADKDGTGKLTREEVGLMMGTAEVQPDPKDIDVRMCVVVATFFYTQTTYYSLEID